jgi:hypothetical protein
LEGVGVCGCAGVVELLGGTRRAGWGAEMVPPRELSAGSALYETFDNIEVSEIFGGLGVDVGRGEMGDEGFFHFGEVESQPGPGLLR